MRRRQYTETLPNVKKVSSLSMSNLGLGIAIFPSTLPRIGAVISTLPTQLSVLAGRISDFQGYISRCRRRCELPKVGTTSGKSAGIMGLYTLLVAYVTPSNLERSRAVDDRADIVVLSLTETRYSELGLERK